MKFDMCDVAAKSLIEEAAASLRTFTLANGINFTADVKVEGAVRCDPKGNQVPVNLVKTGWILSRHLMAA